MGVENVLHIRSAVRDRGYSWSAGATAVSEYTQEKKKGCLGLAISLEQLKANLETALEVDAKRASLGQVSVYPEKWDWRDVLGKNWMTPVKAQGGCGACVAFATVGMIESNLKIFKREALTNPDLSEADLFFNGCGNCCPRGWDFKPALDYAKSKGIPDEACSPWDSDTFRTCPDRANRIIKIEDWRKIPTDSQVKEWLYSKGPVMTGMRIFGDFYYYRSGVYKSAYGGYIGDHAVVIVGYNDLDKYWICKNSWSTSWGEGGWFKIAYGDSEIGTGFGYYGVQFVASDDILISKSGRVIVKYTGRATEMDDEIWLSSPQEKLVFQGTTSNLGKIFDLGVFSSGTRLAFYLKTPDPESNIFYTDVSLNKDVCDHVKLVQTDTYKWSLNWEDAYGLGDRDYDDLKMDVEIFDKETADIVVPKDGRLVVRFIKKGSTNDSQLWLMKPEDKQKQLFVSSTANLNRSFDLGTFTSGTTLVFGLKTPDGQTYLTDAIYNPDSCVHVKKQLTGLNKWTLKWEDTYGLGDKDYDDVVVEVEVMPVTVDDVVMPCNGKVMAKLYSMNSIKENEFLLMKPEGADRSIFRATNQNIRKSFEVGTFASGTRLVFGLKAPDGKIYSTDSSMNEDGRDHVFKLPFGPYKCQLRWEESYNLTNRSYNDLVVELTIIPS